MHIIINLFHHSLLAPLNRFFQMWNCSLTDLLFSYSFLADIWRGNCSLTAILCRSCPMASAVYQLSLLLSYCFLAVFGCGNSSLTVILFRNCSLTTLLFPANFALLSLDVGAAHRVKRDQDSVHTQVAKVVLELYVLDI